LDARRQDFRMGQSTSWAPQNRIAEQCASE
jgi:hypothetical protein